MEAEIVKMRNWERMLAGFTKKPAEESALSDLPDVGADAAVSPAPSRWGKILEFARPRRAG